MDYIFISKKEGQYTLGLVEKDRWLKREVLQKDSKIDNLYICRVLQNLKGQKAFIIEYEKNEKGFLPYSQMITNLKPGDEVLLQYVKEGRNQKFPRFTQKYMILGEYIHLTPWTQEIRASRKAKKDISFDLRKREYGMVIRSAGLSMPEEEIEKEYLELSEMEKRIGKEKNFLPIPRLLVKQTKQIFQFINQYSDTASFIKTNDPLIKKSIKEKTDLEIILDESYDPDYDSILQRDLLNMDKKKIKIDEDREIIFEKTEALVSVDVNYRASSEKLDEKILDTNLHAVFETAIQMELRDLTGIVILDCINMNQLCRKKFSIKVKEILKDFPKISYHGLTSLNLAQFIRTGVKHIDS